MSIEELQRRIEEERERRESLQREAEAYKKISPRGRLTRSWFGGEYGEREPGGLKGEFLKDLRRARTDDEVQKVVDEYVRKAMHRGWKKEDAVKKVRRMVEELQEDGLIL